jgi:hypothetical protein
MKTLLDLEPGDCRYPFGDGPIVFCGSNAVAGSSYCLPHKILCTKATDHPARGADKPHFAAAIRRNNIPKCLVVSSTEDLQ